jgi:signal transduction histidine kinase
VASGPPSSLSSSARRSRWTAIEAAAYYVAAEALANVAKYAHAASARVRIAEDDERGEIVIEVVDDGIGGADPMHGSGLKGLEDRVAALDGMLEIDSPPGAGTRIRARIPTARRVIPL